MNAQQAPSRGIPIWAQQSLRSVALQTASSSTQLTTAGRVDHKNQTDKIVNAMLSGEENKFIRIHAIGPVVRIGGGKLGCLPGIWFVARLWLLIVFFSYRSVNLMRWLYQFMNPEMPRETTK